MPCGQWFAAFPVLISAFSLLCLCLCFLCSMSIAERELEAGAVAPFAEGFDPLGLSKDKCEYPRWLPPKGPLVSRDFEELVCSCTTF